MQDPPAPEYSDRLRQRQADVVREERAFRLTGNLRLLAGIAFAALGFFVFGSAAVSPWWFLLPGGIFLALVVRHARIVARLENGRRSVRFYEHAIARLEDRWSGIGETGERFRNSEHVYADDLDLFGTGSVYQLLCNARTRLGEDRLAAWLLSPSPKEEVLLRQEAVCELAPMVDLRERIALSGQDGRADLNPEKAVAWGERAEIHFPAWVPWLAGVLAAATVITLILWLAGLTGYLPLLVNILVELGFALYIRPREFRALEGLNLPARDLAIVSQLLLRLEEQTFQTPLLRALQKRIKTDGLTAGARIARLDTIVERLELMDNKFFQPIGAALLWTTQWAAALEKWRRGSGMAVRHWVAATGDFEALSALAAYHYEHPGDPFPEFVDRPPQFHGEGLGHPLLPAARAVRNDVDLNAARPLWVVSGSNMSGKSTLLRTVGLNAVLAWAGAPVRAERLVLSPLRVATSLRAQDSLRDGRSRFYAEISRLRQVVDLTAGPLPVLFLLDELLSGTNSHDRRIGAEALVRSLVGRGALGLLTTHDLALADIAESVQPPGANVHFADRIEDGKLYFDYRLHSGVVDRSNALELMRSVGLEV